MGERVSHWVRNLGRVSAGFSPESHLSARFSCTSSSSPSEGHASVAADLLSPSFSASDSSTRSSTTSYIEQLSSSIASSLVVNDSVRNSVSSQSAYDELFSQWLSGGFSDPDAEHLGSVAPVRNDTTYAVPTPSTCINGFFREGWIFGRATTTAETNSTVSHHMVKDVMHKAGQAAKKRMTDMDSDATVVMENEAEYTNLCLQWLLAGFFGGRFFQEAMNRE